MGSFCSGLSHRISITWTLSQRPQNPRITHVISQEVKLLPLI